jgi:hypothetical protein
MIEAGKNSQDEIQKKKGSKIVGKSNQYHEEADSNIAPKKHGFVFKLVRKMGDQNLKDKGDHKSKIGKNANVRIFLDDEGLAIEDGKSRRDNDRGSVVERMEEGGRQEYFFSQFLKRIITMSQKSSECRLAVPFRLIGCIP